MKKMILTAMAALLIMGASAQDTAKIVEKKAVKVEVINKNTGKEGGSEQVKIVTQTTEDGATKLDTIKLEGGGIHLEKRLNLDKLSPGQIYELEQKRIEYSKLTPDQVFQLEKERAESKNESSPEDIIIPVIAIGSPFVAAVLLVFFILWYKEKERKGRYALLEKAIDSGREIPADFFKEPKKEPVSTLQSALVLIAAGLGLVIFLSSWRDLKMFSAAGFIPMFIGIGKLIAWFIESKRAKKTDLTPPAIEEENQ